jgi:aspartate/methionine/tyrosine aminotransferase
LRLSNRAQAIKASGIRKVFELGATIKDPIDLSIGQPDFSIPDVAKAEAHKAIDEGYTRYTLTQGIPQLISKVNEYYLKNYGVKAEETVITAGVAGALCTAFFSLLEDGDEIIIPDPTFMMYEQWANYLGAKAVKYNIYPDFHPNADEIESLITPRTRLILILSPSNPTGGVVPEETLKKVAKIAAKHNILVISDEIYERFCYDSAPTTISKFYKNVLIMGGFSKFAGMPGMRLGYALGPKELIMEMRKIQQFSFVCAPSISQRIGVVMMDYDFTETLNRYRVKRDIIFKGLSPLFKLVKPEGAFYAFPQAPWGTSTQFVENAIKNKVLIIPGKEFSERDTHFRISFAADDDKLRKGIEILNALAENPPDDLKA